MSNPSNPSNPSFSDFGKLVPGFDFLQNLAKQAGSATQAIPQLPNLANWIAPTLNVEELDKRVQELKAVQFWLDQNAAALKATIQALEVQKMTLATLKGMNFTMGEVANAFALKTGNALPGGAQRPADKGKGFAGLEIPPSNYQTDPAGSAQADTNTNTTDTDTSKKRPATPTAAAAATGGLADPMQWWGALTQQFQAIATDAMQEAARHSAGSLTTSLAKDAVKTATSMASGLARNLAATTGKAMAGSAPVPLQHSRGSAAPKSPAPSPASAKKTGAKKATPATSRKAPAASVVPAGKPASRPAATPAARKAVGRKIPR